LEADPKALIVAAIDAAHESGDPVRLSPFGTSRWISTDRNLKASSRVSIGPTFWPPLNMGYKDQRF